MAPNYDVFISHAGEDKAPMGILIYKGLKRRGISAFLDEKELRVAGDAVKEMDEAMKTALVGLFILSQEFALKAYPMLELECFLKRAGLLEESGQESTRDRPALIPVFYRLTVAGCKYAEAFRNMECNRAVRERFDEKVKNGVTSEEKVLERLTLLAGRTGVENKTGIGNDDTEEMKKRREVFAEKVCDEVTAVLMEKARKGGLHSRRDCRMEEDPADELHPTFLVPKNPKEVKPDFSNALASGKAQTYEAQVLREVIRNDTGCKIIAMIGAGGVGKSCILREVARHEDVKKRFPGGVYFVSLGMDASANTLRLELLRILTISGGKHVAERMRDEASLVVTLEEVGKLVGKGRSLVLLDDVWERNGIQAKIALDMSDLLSIHRGGMVVLTTRSASVASMGDVVIHIKPREAVSQIARDILFEYAKFNGVEVEKEGLGWVVEKLLMIGGGLPVCLAVIGRGVGRYRVLLQMKAWVMYWEKIRGRTETLLRTDVDDYKALEASLSVALHILEENEKAWIGGWSYSWSEMYRSLCVMEKQREIPVCLLQRLWKLNHASAVLLIAEGFASVGLGEIVFEGDEVTGLKVHDLLHDFAATLARGRDEVTEWHKRLLDGYICARADKGAREWWSLEDDGYIHENVCRHLRDSGCSEELSALLITVQWTNSRLELGGLMGWKQDFSYCLEAREKERENTSNIEKLTGLCLVRDAVTESWAFLAPNERERLAFQIYGRLQEAKQWPARKYLDSVREWQTGLWLKPDRECWPRLGTSNSGEIPLGSDKPLAVALYGKPLHAVVGCTEGVLCIINLRERRVVKRLSGGEPFVKQVAVTNDEGCIISCSWDGMVRRWATQEDVETGCTVLSDSGGLTGTSKRIWNPCNVAFSPCCKMLVRGSKYGEVVVRDVETGERVGSVMSGFDCEVWCVDVSADGTQVVAGGEDGSLRMWKLSMPALQLWTVVKGHQRGILCVAISSDGRFVVSGAEDGTLQLWNASNGEKVGRCFIGHMSNVLCLKFCPDSTSFVSGGIDCTIQVWKVENGDIVREKLRRHSSRIDAMAVSADGRFVVYLCSGSVIFWDLEDTAESIDDAFVQGPTVSCLATSSDHRFCVSGHFRFPRYPTLRVWSIGSGRQVGEPLQMRTLHTYVSSVALSAYTRPVICGMEDGTMRAWDLVSRSQIGSEICGHTGEVNSIAYSPNGRWIVSGSADKTARLWSVESHAQVHVSGVGVTRHEVGGQLGPRVEARSIVEQRVYEHECAVTHVTFSGDGKRIVSGLESGKLCVWDTSSGTLVGSSNSNHQDSVARIDVNNDHIRSLDRHGRQMRWQIESEGRLISISEASDGMRIERPEGEGVRTLPRGDQIVCTDRVVRLGAGGRIIASLPAALGPMNNTWFYDSSRGVLVTALWDGQVLFSRFVR